MNDHLADTGFNDLLTAGALWLLAACGCWAVLICTAASVEAATGGRLPATAWVGCPPALRRTLLALLGVALVTTPGHAAASNAGGPAPEHAAAPLPVPARPLGGTGDGARIVVRPGDTLWQLASARLPTTATTGEVCELVGRLHRRNREVIGPDPDLIRPGQRLVTVRRTT